MISSVATKNPRMYFSNWQLLRLEQILYSIKAIKSEDCDGMLKILLKYEECRIQLQQFLIDNYNVFNKKTGLEKTFEAGKCGVNQLAKFLGDEYNKTQFATEFAQYISECAVNIENFLQETIKEIEQRMEEINKQVQSGKLEYNPLRDSHERKFAKDRIRLFQQNQSSLPASLIADYLPKIEKLKQQVKWSETTENTQEVKKEGKITNQELRRKKPWYNPF